MHYTKATLSALTKEAIVADIKRLTWKEELVYPDWPQGYERSFDAFERFVVTEPRQEILTPGEYAENGTEITPPVLGNWVSHLVLPLAYDTSNLNTLLTNES